MNKELIKAEGRDMTELRLSQLATEIRIYSSNMLINIIEIGRRFEEAKSLCPHGEFGKWCKECAGYEQSMVENYIKIYKEYGGGQLNLGGDFTNSQSIATLGVTKLLELAKVPADERVAFVEENNITTDTTVKELKEKIKALEVDNERLVVEAKRNEDLRVKEIKELTEERDEAKRAIENNEETIASLKEQIETLNNAPAVDANSEELAEMIYAADDEEKEKLKAAVEKLEDENTKLKDKQKKNNEKIKELEADIKASRKKDAELTEELLQAKNEISKLKKAAEASGDTSIAKIEVLFTSVQNDLAELAGLIRVSGKEELLPKIKAVVEGLLEKTR
ncbi:MAG: DUF3102 domain-containing protein [Clostridia bacterium]|nr:DUF3102 domain-containing protein [Clostridia bacterium]